MMRLGIFAVVSVFGLMGCSASTAFLRQGQHALAAGDYDRAAHAFSLALVEHPQHAGALTWLGIAYYRQEAFDAAIDALERAEAIAPDDPRIRLYLGLASLRQGQLDGARQHLAAFLERVQNRSVAEQTLRTLTVLAEATPSEGMRDYIAYSLETSVQQAQRVEALREQVRALEAQRHVRPSPLVFRRSRKRS
jgi:tetratricopeptide (TPR) repeat protein